MKLLVFLGLLGAVACREKRSFGLLSSSVGSFFTTTPSPLSKYPLWKVHKYTGIDLKPVQPEETHDHAIETDGHPPKVLQVEQPKEHVEHSDSSSELSMDQLQSLAHLLPEEAQNNMWSTLAGLGRSDEAEDKIGLIKPKGLLGLLTLGGLTKTIVGNYKNFLEGVVSHSNPPDYHDHHDHHDHYDHHDHVETTVYRGVPTVSSGSFFSKIPVIGGAFVKGTPVYLPDPVLPNIPHLKVVPEAPKLPKLTLPGKYKLPYSTGSYVRIKVPKPHVVFKDQHEYTPPSTSYGYPDLSTQYKIQEPVDYQPPQPVQYHISYPQLSNSYGAPAVDYKQTYQQPQTDYGAPADYKQTYQQPQTDYGSPADYKQTYQQPQTDYGAPAQFPAPTVESNYRAPQYEQFQPSYQKYDRQGSASELAPTIVYPVNQEGNQQEPKASGTVEEPLKKETDDKTD